jgi:hypothetical protein
MRFRHPPGFSRHCVFGFGCVVVAHGGRVILFAEYGDLTLIPYLQNMEIRPYLPPNAQRSPLATDSPSTGT